MANEFSKMDEYLEALPRKVRVGLLFGVYGGLLNENRRRVLAMWLDEDYSLAEIAQEENISRQGVYDSVKKSEQILSQTEQQLGVVRRMLIQDSIMRACEHETELPASVTQAFDAMRQLWEDNPWPLKD